MSLCLSVPSYLSVIFCDFFLYALYLWYIHVSVCRTHVPVCAYMEVRAGLKVSSSLLSDLRQGSLTEREAYHFGYGGLPVSSLCPSVLGL